MGGSISQPNQEFASVDPIIGSVLLQEFSGQAVKVGKAVGKGEGDLPILIRLFQGGGGDAHQGGVVN